LENEHLRVQISSNGTLTIQDKATGQVYRDLGYFEDGGDCGDGYNYSYPVEDRLENTLGLAPQISRVSHGPAVQCCRIDYDWRIPESLDFSQRKRSETRLSCPVSVFVSLAHGTPRLELQVTFDNHARDHRLRIVFPSDVNTETSHASAQFDVVSRPIAINPVTAEAWVEDAPNTFPNQDWVDLSDGERGFCILTRGLPEYEVIDTKRRELVFTLLRAIGHLGAGANMQTADVGAGPHLATPEAQVQRRLTFTLAVLPHAGTWDQAEVWRHALAFNNPPRVVTTGMVKNQLKGAQKQQPPNQSLFSIEGRNVVLSSLKKAESGEALVLRLYNPTNVPTQATIQLPFIPANVQRVGLDELPQTVPNGEPAPPIDAGGKLRLELPPKKIVSLRVER
jgi:alpha-mannosidase